MGRRTCGTSDLWDVGLVGRRTCGMSDLWDVGLVGCRTYGGEPKLYIGEIKFESMDITKLDDKKKTYLEGQMHANAEVKTAGLAARCGVCNGNKIAP